MPLSTGAQVVIIQVGAVTELHLLECMLGFIIFVFDADQDLFL